MGVPVVTAAKGIALDIISQTAEEKSADIFIANSDFSASYVTFDGQYQYLRFVSELAGINFDYKLKMLGDHQIENSSLAIMTAGILTNSDERINKQNIIDGLAVAKWPARFEPFIINGQSYIVDGAHNPAGMKIFRENLDKYYPDGKRVILLGILKDKDIDAMLDYLLRDDDEIVITTPDSERKASPEYIAEKIKNHHVELFDNMYEALNAAKSLANKEKLLCITGSLYLTGELRYALVNELKKVE